MNYRNLYVDKYTICKNCIFVVFGNIPLNKPVTMDKPTLEYTTSMDECSVLEMKTLKQFWYENRSHISVELYKSELNIQIRELYGRSHSKSGIVMNLLTFYELGRKIRAISCSLYYTSESTIINNSLLCIVKHNTVLLKQFNEFELLKDEIRFNSKQLKNFQVCLSQAEDFIIEYVFTEQLEPSVCFDKPYELCMDSAFRQLKDLIENDLKWTFRALYPTCSLNTQTENNNTCENRTNLPNTLKMLCRISTIQDEFLTKNNLLASGVYDFKRLSMELFQT